MGWLVRRFDGSGVRCLLTDLLPPLLLFAPSFLAVVLLARSEQGRPPGPITRKGACVAHQLVIEMVEHGERLQLLLLEGVGDGVVRVRVELIELTPPGDQMHTHMHPEARIPPQCQDNAKMGGCCKDPFNMSRHPKLSASCTLSVSKLSSIITTENSRSRRFASSTCVRFRLRAGSLKTSGPPRVRVKKLSHAAVP